MKPKLFTLLLTVAASVGTMFAWNYVRVQIGDLYYNLDVTNQTAEVTSQNRYVPYWSTTITTANIPDSVTYSSKTYSVTSIGEQAFMECSGLTSVTIPGSVTSIGSSAFFNCSSLTSVTIPGSVTSIGGAAFWGCSGLTSVTIPNSVTSIESDAFSGCSGLTSVTIPNSVTSIGYRAFDYCSGLTSLSVEAGNTVYDSRNNCNAIIETSTNTLIFGCQNTTIPNSVTSIGDYAFSGCSGLTSVTIPNSVTSIGVYAFEGCSGLTSPLYNAHVFAYMPTSYSGAYTIPDGIESIAGGAFYKCSGLTSVTIPNSVTSIGEHAFSYCHGLTSVTIPNSVTSIGTSAFSQCSGLMSIEIPNSVTSIGESAFYGSGLFYPIYNAHVFAYLPTSYPGAYTIPDGIESIAGGAFSYCRGLTSVTIPNSVTSIGYRAFIGCRGLTSPIYNAHVFAYLPTSYSGAYTIPDGIESIAGGAFYGSGLTSVTIPNSVTSIGEDAFSYCDGLTSVTIPNSVTSIGTSAFSQCIGLTFVTIPNSVTSIGDLAFYNCDGLTSVTIPNSVTNIGKGTFSYCRSLTSVTIPNSITSIGNYAFYNCTGLTSVTIPSSVTSIGNYAFYNCTGLTSVTIEAETPPALGSSVFYNTNNCPIYVPCGTIDAYTSAWPEYANRIISMQLNYQITGNVNIEGAGSVQLPQYICDDIVIIAVSNYGYHFTKWSDGNTDNPRTIVLTQDTTFTAEFAINRTGTCGDNNALKWTYDTVQRTLNIEGNGTLNSNYTFGLEAPTQMQKLVIDNNVKSIGDYAFYNCRSLTSVTIGNNVTCIGDYAFSDCSGLTSITIKAETPPELGINTFINTNDCPIYVPYGTIDAYTSAWPEYAHRIISMPLDALTTGSVNIEETSTRKIIHNGQIYIIHCGTTYTLTGQEVK